MGSGCMVQRVGRVALEGIDARVVDVHVHSRPVCQRSTMLGVNDKRQLGPAVLRVPFIVPLAVEGATPVFKSPLKPRCAAVPSQRV